MAWKALMAAALACLMIVCVFGLFAGDAHAQSESKPSFSERKGLSGLLAGKKDTEGKGPNNLQVALGIGSFFVMIAVVKWL